MEGRFNVALLVALVAAAAVLHGSSAQTTHVVGDALGWTIPPGGDVAYRTWAATRTFRVGDVLVFNFTTGAHDVAEVSKAAYDSCNIASTISMMTNGPARISLTSAGEHHYICTIGRHCAAGQKLSINVSAGGSVAPAPQPTTPPPQPASNPPAAAPEPSTAAAPTSPRAVRSYTVGDNLGWTVPRGGPAAYQTWTRGKSFAIGDTLVFNFQNGRHDVLEVTRAEFDSCNLSTTTASPITTSPARVPLTSSGDHYYICAIPGHCSAGQKLAINVGSTSGAAPSPTSGSPTSQPNAPFTPLTPATAPPPPDSSAPLAAGAGAALPLALLIVGLAFWQN